MDGIPELEGMGDLNTEKIKAAFRSKHAVLIILGLCFLVLMLATILLQRDVWFDEAFTMQYIKFDYQYIMQPHDVHPPAYYLVAKSWSEIFGYGVVNLRILSMFFGLGSFIFIYMIVMRLFKDKKFFFIFGVFFIFASQYLHYFTEVRMYAMGFLFCTMSFYFLLKYMDERKGIVPLAISTALIPFIHYYAVFFILLEGIFFIAVELKRNKALRVPWKDVGVAAIFFLSWIPLCLYFLAQMKRFDGHLYFGHSTFYSILSTYFAAFFRGFGKGIVGYISQTGTIIGLIFIMLCFGVIYLYLRGKDNYKKFEVLILTAAYLLIPIIGMSIVYVAINAYHHRFFFFVGWIFVMCIMWMIYKLKKPVSTILTVLFIAVAVFHTGDYFLHQDKDVQNAYFRVISDCKEFEMSGKEMVVFHETPFTFMPFEYYRSRTTGCKAKMVNLWLSERPLVGMRSFGADATTEDKIVIRNSTDEIVEYLNSQSEFYIFDDESVNYTQNLTGLVDEGEVMEGITLFRRGGLISVQVPIVQNKTPVLPTNRMNRTINRTAVKNETRFIELSKNRTRNNS